MESIFAVTNATNFQSFDPNTVYLVYATVAISIVTAVGIGLTSWLTRKSLIETRKSNTLLRTEINARLKPILRVHNTGLEPSGTSEPNYDPKWVFYHPNLRNDGSVEASHFKINFKAMEREVNLEEIVRQEKEIEKQSLLYDGSISSNGGIGVMDAINVIRTEKPISVVLWINYKFLDDVSDTIIFNIIFNGTGNFWRGTIVKNYTATDIMRVRKEIKIKNEGAPM